MKKILSVLGVLLVFVWVSGCTQTTSPAPTSTTSTTPPPVSTTTSAPTSPTATTTPSPGHSPTISIVSPLDEARVWTGNVTVSVRVSNFNLVDRLGEPAAPGEGHIHYFYDVKAPATPGQPATTAPGTYAATTATSHTWNIAGRGIHLLSVELVNNDHTSLDPPVVASVAVNARFLPQLEIVSPGAGSNVSPGDLLLTVDATDASDYRFIYNLDVNPPLAPGEPAVTGEGTYAVSEETSYLWPAVPAGDHIFTVQVVNSDLTPLEPPVVASVTFSVGGRLTTTTPPEQHYFFGPAGIDILDIAVAGDGTTIYVAAKADTSKKLVYRSTDSGATWTDISRTPGLNLAATNLIAVAPDDPDIAVVADMEAGAACVTTDGGNLWTSMGAIADGGGGGPERVYDLDISAQRAGIRYVACAATLDTSDGNSPALFYFDLGAPVPAWRDAVKGFRTLGGSNLVTGEIDAIRAVRFSPSFPSDGTLLAVSGQIGSVNENGVLRLHALNLTSFKWDQAAGFAGYPVTLDSSSGISSTAGSVSISPDPDYDASDEGRRTVFVGAQITDRTRHRELGGIYRVDDTSAEKILEAPVYSVAYNGTVLVAGMTTDGAGTPSNAVYYSLEPLSSSPVFSITPALKRPSGETAVIALWAGDDVVAGTSGSGSAFSVSRDGGQSFNGISLIEP
jgi:hypothetical protein